MSFKGMLLKAGIDTDGVYVSFKNGFGLNVQDVQMLRSRIATGTVGGSYLDIDATTFWYEEGVELRYNVIDWVDASVSGYDGTTNGNGYLGAFTGFKIATQCATESAAGKTLQGIDSDCRVNNVTAGAVSSIKAHVSIKGSSAKTVASVFGGESEVEVFNASGTLTVTTSMIAHEFRMRVSAAVADSTNRLKCHGIVVKCGDTDGQTVTIGTGLLIENYASGGGNVTWTKGLEITDCITCIVLGGYGRVVTSTAAGAYVDIDASGAQYQEGFDLKYNVIDWEDSSVAGYSAGVEGSGYLGSFTGLKIQTQASTEDALTKTLQGIDSDARVNNFDLGSVSSIKAHVSIKGSAAKTVGTVLGGESEVEVFNASGTLTINTAMIAHEFRMRTSTAVAGGNLLKCHGIVVKCGDTDGQTVTVGTGLLIENYSSGGGTVSWTTGLSITDCLNGISVTGTFTGKIIRTSGIIDSGGLGDGVGAHEYNLDLTGTSSNHMACTSAWVNIISGTHGVGGQFVAAQTNGIWRAAGTISAAKIIFGMRMIAQLATSPNTLCPFSIQVTGDACDALIDVGTVAQLGYIANTGENINLKLGVVPLIIDSNSIPWYVNVYSGAAQ